MKELIARIELLRASSSRKTTSLSSAWYERFGLLDRDIFTATTRVMAPRNASSVLSLDRFVAKTDYEFNLDSELCTREISETVSRNFGQQPSIVRGSCSARPRPAPPGYHLPARGP